MQNSNTYLFILLYLHHKTSADFQSKQGVGGGGEVVSKLDYFLFLNISEGNLGTPVGRLLRNLIPQRNFEWYRTLKQVKIVHLSDKDQN